MRVRFRKSDLLEKLRKNLARHAVVVAEAREGYRKKAKEALEEVLRTIELGHTPPLDFSKIVYPCDYTKEYKKAIELFELSSAQEFDLEENDYRRYIHDEWNWKQAFLLSNSNYSASARLEFNGGE